MKCIVVSSFGAPDVLELVDRPNPQGEVLVRAAWAGVNFVDLYQREGRYPGVSLPLVPGLEGSGLVTAAPETSEWKVGDRVAFSTGMQGSYAETVAVPERHLVPVPPGVSSRDASGSLEHGLTALVLADDVARLDARRTLLVHAAAGGVGGWVVQILKNRGYRVIGTASSAEKLARLPDAEPLRRKARAVFDTVLGQTIEVRVHGEYALARAADAHSDLAFRNTAGKLLLSIAPELF